MGGVATKLVDRNTTIPASRSQIFSTAADNQTSVQIRVFQGERAMFADNKELGQFILDGIPPAGRGMPQVEVTLDVDANGILNVKAVEKTTGKAQSITIKGSSGLSKDDVEKMKKEAEAHAKDDAEKKELVEVKNTADNMIYTAEKSLKDAGDKVPADIKTSVEVKIAEVKKVKEPSASSGQVDITALKTATEALSNELQKIGEAMQKAQTEASANQAKPDETKTEGGDTVRDAEVKEEPKS
jgi:molecular chaperone DnaK